MSNDNEPSLRLTVEASRKADGTPRIRVLRVDRSVDYGQLSLTELQYLIDALLPGPQAAEGLRAVRPPAFPQ